MKTKIGWISLAILAILLSACGGGASGNNQSAHDQQVSAGQTVYTESCAECHGANLEGVDAPALTADNLSKRFQTAQSMFSYISSSMPLSNPGSLSKDQYLQAEAYILSQTGQLPADQALTTNNLSNISISQ